MRVDRINSYTAADGIPIKLITDTALVEIIKTERVIPPVHVQFIPTNRCNMACDFCSCSGDDRQTEMSLENAKAIIEKLYKLGTKAVTITGGGEPLMHPYIGEMIGLFTDAGIEVGLVTNGLLLNGIPEVFGKIKWCRISNGDKRHFTEDYADRLAGAISANPEVDWAFSHVVSPEPNHNEIRRIIEFANIHKFTHTRLVADLMQPERVDMDSVRETVSRMGVDDRLIVYQARNRPSRGGDCFICYLKPVIGADCRVYTCCGAQYALMTRSRCFPPELCLGSAFDLDRIMANSYKPFDGHICERCYYTNYNAVLKAMLSEIDHERFV